MAVSVSEVCIRGRVLCLSPRQRVNLPNPIRFTTTRWSSSVVLSRALNPKSEDQNSTSSFQEDLAYVGKLVVGSFVGAGAIKYGSALYPEITTPNLLLALFIISTPVIVAVLLLIKESSTKP
ncbi:hypothetical protein RJT34_25970 [Clitoria ternatea]|uniref:Uncharacterized protein n=1 Tax=Clitoria ternatea TaxID=43366 RepID=A0AAN9F645_CLITE